MTTSRFSALGKVRLRRSVLALSTILSSTLGCGLAHGQNIGGTPPIDVAIDGNGVDILNRQRSTTFSSISLGPGGPGSLTYILGSNWTMQSDINTLLQGSGTTNGSSYTAVIGGSREDFVLNGTLGSGTFTSKGNIGSTLTYSAATQQYTYTTGNGTVAVFSKNIPGLGTPAFSPKALSLTYPAGETLTFYYRPPIGGVDPTINAIASNLGYQMHFSYTGFTGGTVVIFNMADETCDPAAITCTLTGNWPTLSWSSSTGTTVTKNGQAVVTYGPTSSTSVTESYASGKAITYNVDSGGLVTSLRSEERRVGKEC